MRHLIAASVLGLAGSAVADIINVPADYSTIQAAVNAAVDGDEVVVAPGVYTGGTYYVVNIHGKSIVLRSSSGPSVTTIDAEYYGGGIDPRGGINVYGPDPVRIEGFTITRSGGNGVESAVRSGSGSDITIINCLISENRVIGIKSGDDTTITIAGCTISDNYYGGITCAAGNISTISDCTISDIYYSGYGITLYPGSISSSITNCTISNCVNGINGAASISGCIISDQHGNGSTSGTGVRLGAGGVLADCTIFGCDVSGIVCVSGSPSITNCIIQQNGGGWGDCGGESWCHGGGVHCINGSSPIITNCTISGNVGSNGGGICCGEDSSPTISDCTIKNNTGRYGGGIACVSNSAPTISDCTISGNTGSDGGGGIACVDNSTPTITGCTISENTSTWAHGGGVYTPSDLWGGACNPDCPTSRPFISNSIICGNAPNQIGGPWSDEGDVCLALSCSDADEDGAPDECAMVSDGIHEVPGEYSTIQQAVNAAGSGDVVLVGPGTWYGSGDEVFSTTGKPITIRSTHGPDVTVLDGQDERRGIKCDSGEMPSTIIEGFTIRNGITDSSGGGYRYGGGILCYGSSPTIRDCIITENRTPPKSIVDCGAGIALARSESLIENCIISNNHSRYTAGVFALGGAVQIVNSEIKGNVSEEGLGGGIYVWGPKGDVDSDEAPLVSLDLVDSAVVGNQSGKSGYLSAGGLMIFGSAVTALNCSFTDNNCVGEYDSELGGGITSASSHVELLDCVISDNESGGEVGGGFANYPYSGWRPYLLIQGCSFTSNNSLSLEEGSAISGLDSYWCEISNTTVCGSGPLPVASSWQDGGGNWISSDCPGSSGACCSGADCTVTAEIDCSGDWLGEGSDCNGDPCPSVSGACCIGQSCSTTTEADCSGDWLGEGTNCNGDPCYVPPPPGACCVLDVWCFEDGPDDCEDWGGIFVPDTWCADTDCLTGACCIGPDGMGEYFCIPDSSYDYCSSFSVGTFYPSQSCDVLECDPNLGACCIFTGECAVMTQDECPEWVGVFHPDYSCFSEVCGPLPPTGACCINGSCYDVTTEADCSGDWLGEGTDCDGDPCYVPPTGACCINGSCYDVTTEADCSGDWLGEGTDCDGDPCYVPPTGACCINELCSVTTETDCSGDWLGESTDCNGDPCYVPPSGACCIGQSCTVTTEAGCSGDWLGESIDCANNPCDTQDKWTVDDDGPADFDNIQDAVNAASNGDTVTVMPGTYRGDGSSVVDLLGKSFALIAAGTTEETIIDGEGSRRAIVCIDGANSIAQITGFTFTNGHALYGAGIYLSNSNVILENCDFVGNGGEAACDDGGAIALHNSSTAAITGSMFSTNSATYGGAIYLKQGSEATVVGCSITNNLAGQLGGGVYCEHSNLSLENCAVSSNTAHWRGGGIDSQLNCTLTLSNCTIEGNMALAGDGGGICHRESPDQYSSLTSCTISNNTSSYAGGGAYCVNSVLMLSSCTISDNSAGNEGGGFATGTWSEIIPVFTDTIVCNNVPDQMYGAWEDAGSNTIADECPTDCTGDLDGNGEVGVDDLLALLAAYQLNADGDCDGDGDTDVDDLLILISAWGPCP